MRILILTVGTRGDVQPYVALGRGLRAAGHETAICTCSQFADMISAHGLQYLHMNNELLDFMHTDDGRTAMENTGNLFQAVCTGIRLWPKVRSMLHRQIDDMWQACGEFQPELILFHKKALGAEDFAEKLRIPCALAFYLPLYVPTREFPAMGFPHWPLGGWYNRFTYRLVDWVTRLSTGRFVAPWRRAQEMPKRRAVDSRSSVSRPVPVLHAYSPSVIPEPSDWPDTATATGYWFLDDPQIDWTPPQPLVQFLNDGPPPVYIGFGSIFGSDPQRTGQIVMEAVSQAGVRAILATGWGGLDVSDAVIPDSVCVTKSVPHDWLFPQVAAVVHHGGCGTTAAALRAGRPSVVCPFFGDQPFWGRTLHRLGAGPEPILQKRLTADRLAAAIRCVLDDDRMRSTAVELGRRIRAEHGVANAVRFVERVFIASPQPSE